MVIGIIGCGRVGTSFANALSRKLPGGKVLLCKGIKRSSRSHLQGYDFLSSRVRFVNNIRILVKSSDIVFVAVKDDKIEDVVKKIVNLNVKIEGKYFVHFSGVLDSRIFLPIRKKFNVKIASLHPVQSFPSVKLGMERIKNIYWVFEGDEDAYQSLDKLIKLLGGKIIVLDKEWKVYHHIICVFFSNFLVGLFYVAKELMNGLNVDELESLRSCGNSGKLNLEIYLPLIKGVISNIEGLDPHEALTGPIVRGDVHTVKTHIKYLQKYPQFLRYYKQFSGILLDMVKDRVDKVKYMLMKKLITKN